MRGRTRKPVADRDQWLGRALRAFVLEGGIETPANQLPLVLFLFDCLERGMTSTRAGVEAAERYHDGEFERRA